MSVPAVSLRGVAKTFGTTRAVSDLDLEVPAGSLCGFLGPNGAGKSTTIRMVMSILRPDVGTIEVLGSDALQNKDRIGYLPEERGVYRKMRVGEFLMYIGRLKGRSGADLKPRISAWLERVGLAGYEKRRCEELSKGMQQKVQFLAAVLHDPELVILDEPFSGLDPVNADLLRTLIQELHAEGRTVLFSTHILHQAEQICDRILLLERGDKLLDATLDEVRERFNPRTIVARGAVPFAAWKECAGVADARVVGPDTVELEVAESQDPRALMRELFARFELDGLELKQVRLEEVFVRLTQGRTVGV